MAVRGIIAFAFIFLMASSAFAQTSVPALMGRVNDYADVLTPVEESALEATLANIEETYEGHPQVAVLTMNTIGEQDIRDYGIDVFNTWGLGQKDLDNGLLIFLITGGDAVHGSIETGGGMEGDLPDARLSVIFNRNMKKHFEANPRDYAGGLSEGISIMATYIRGEKTGDTSLDEAVEIELRQGGSIFVGIIGFLISALIGAAVGWKWSGSSGFVFGAIAGAIVPLQFSIIILILGAVIGGAVGAIAWPLLQLLIHAGISSIGNGGGSGSWRGGGGSSSGGGIKF